MIIKKQVIEIIYTETLKLVNIAIFKELPKLSKFGVERNIPRDQRNNLINALGKIGVSKT